MRKVTKKLVDAFYAGKGMKDGTGAVRVEEDTDTGKVVYLEMYGKPIAKQSWGSVWICDGGNASNTIRDRLRGVVKPLGLIIYSSKGKIYVEDSEIGPEWLRVRSGTPEQELVLTAIEHGVLPKDPIHVG